MTLEVSVSWLSAGLRVSGEPSFEKNFLQLAQPWLTSVITQPTIIQTSIFITIHGKKLFTKDSNQNVFSEKNEAFR